MRTGTSAAERPIRAEVHLHAIDAALAARIVAGTPGPDERWHAEYPFANELDVLRPIAAGRLVADPVFGPYQVLEDGTAVGGIGFFGPPDGDGVVELGYGLVSAARGWGIAAAALAAMLEIARTHGAQTVRAETDPANTASVRLLERAGFTRTSPTRWAHRCR